MFKIVPLEQKYPLTEAPQRNPLRWTFVRKEKQTLFQIAPQMKCKDYFNDVVALYKSGRRFTEYGFPNELVPMGKRGICVLLDNVNREVFLHNLEVLNKQIVADTGDTITHSIKLENKEQVLIHIPVSLFESTYLISLTTMLLRVGNYNKKFSSYEDFFSESSPMNSIEQSFTQHAKTLAKEHKFKSPREGHWRYIPGALTKSDEEVHQNHIHYNGVSNWAQAIMLENA